MDSKDIVSKLQSREREISVLGPLVQEMKLLLQTRRQWKVSWVRRSANNAAHLLAMQEGVSSSLCKLWLVEPSDCILQALSAEMPTFYE